MSLDGRGRLDGRVCLITGASAGLGRVAANLFAQQGGRIVIADLADGSEVVDEIRADGGEATYVHCDVTDDDSMHAAVAHAVNTFSGLHVLYNNAGVSLADDSGPEDTPNEVWETTLRINVIGLATGCRHGIPAMLDTVSDPEDAAASIINVASFVAHMGAATPQIAYTASKGAVLAMTREIAVQYGRSNIRANALCPGPVLTPLLAKYMEDDWARERRLAHVPMGRFGEGIEIANGALFLATDESSFMTGQSLLIDGGITAAYTTPVSSEAS